MESCYINTAHPDFLNGHQAIAMVGERLHPKPQPNGVNGVNGADHGKPASRNPGTPTTAHQTPSLSTSNSPMSVESNSSENGSFFGSFFAGNKKPKKSGSALMDSSVFETVCVQFYGLVADPFSFP
jgi:dynamin 1-like protein